MGYAFGWTSKDDIVRELLTQGSGPIRIIDHALVGNHLWTVCQFTTAADPFPAGFRFVQLNILASARGEWGYKTISESAHPFYYDCPERLLAASDDMGESATRWREKCRVEHSKRAERRAFLKALAPGDAVIVDDERPATFSRALLGETRSVAIKLDGREYRVAKARLRPPPAVVA